LADKEDERLSEAASVVKEVVGTPDGVPQSLADKAYCVIVFPSVKKAGFIVGGSYGRGVMTCRTGTDFKGPWGPPSMMALEGASFGLQAGGEATDFVLLVMNEKGARSILSSKVKLGGDASIAAGPVGRNASAETDAAMNAEILSYSRSKGVFAGVSLEGSTVRADNDANKSLYGKKIEAKDLVLQANAPVPDAAKPLLSELNQVTPKRVG
jgi:lipid-binding SYLF domain-containing protein